MKIVLILTWREGDQIRTQAYGTWEARDDGSHHGEIAAFMKDHVTGKEPVSAMLYVLDPVN